MSAHSTSILDTLRSHVKVWNEFN